MAVGIRVIMTDAKTIVTVWLCAFGGISSVAQTYSVLSGTDLSIKKYVIAKIRRDLLQYTCIIGVQDINIGSVKWRLFYYGKKKCLEII